MIRSVFAVVAGFMTWAVLTIGLWVVFGYGPREVPSQGFLMFSLLFEVAFALAAGYLTALIARRRESVHGAILAGAMALDGVAAIAFTPDAYPLWVNLSTIFILAPACYAGSNLRVWWTGTFGPAQPRGNPGAESPAGLDRGLR
jgi:hypothetical protein